MSIMSTLHEIAVEKATKQPGMVDTLTEDAPILEKVKWTPSSHGLWNVAEKLSNIEGPGFVEADAPLPHMSADSDLVHTDLFVMGGTMEVPTLRAAKFGGPEKYFARKQEALLKKSGMDTEVQLVKKNWLAAARAAKNLRSAGGTAKGWFIMAVRFDPLANVGLYDPDQFDTGRLFKIEVPYNGAEHMLHHGKNKGVLGYSVVYRAIFGWQNLDAKKTCSAIVNIDATNHPTAAQVDDMLADVRAQPGTTIIVCSPRGRIHGLDPLKRENIMLVNGDSDMNTQIQTWGGIPIIPSHNFNDPIDNISVS